MVLKDKSNNRYIGSLDNKVFSLNNRKIIEKDSLELDEDKKAFDNLKVFLSNNLTLFSVLNILLNSKKIPLLVGHVYYNKKNSIPLLLKEFSVDKIDDLEKCIGNLKNNNSLSFFLIDDEIDIQYIREFCRLSNVKYSIYHLISIDDDSNLSNETGLIPLYIPKFIHDVMNK